MTIIGLFFPALISLKIALSRNSGKTENVSQTITTYGIYVLINNWLAQVVITYILNVSDVTADAFNSFPFFIKYIVISAVISIVVPFVAELIGKYFKISIETGTGCGKDENDEESN